MMVYTGTSATPPVEVLRMILPTRRTTLRLLFIGLLFVCSELFAQDDVLPASQPLVLLPATPTAGALEPLGNGTAPLIRQAPLDAVVVFNANGKQQIHLPGWRLEDLDEIRELHLKERQTLTPSYSLQEISATGLVVNNHVEAEMKIVLTTVADRSVLVPLGLNEGVFPSSGGASHAAPFRYTGPGTLEMMADPATGQYLALIHPPNSLTPQAEEREGMASTTTVAGTIARTGVEEKRPVEPPQELRHELQLTVWFPLTRLGMDESRLSVSFPPAVSSQFLLTVPLRDAVATVTQGGLPDSAVAPNENTTCFKMLGLKPDFALAWRQKRIEPTDARPVLSVEDASIIAKLEAQTTSYDVSLPVRSRTAAFDRLQIRLPQGVVLDQESTNRHATLGGYSLALSSDAVPTLDIRLPQKTPGPVPVRFKAILHDGAMKLGDWRNLSGFEVLGAERQTGRLAVIIPENMRPTWNPVQGIRRLESEAAGAVTTTDGNPSVQDSVSARFEFFSQPFQLRCKMASPQTKINVKPEYQVRIDQGRLLLTARFAYTVFGSTEKLTVRLPGWQWNNDISPIGMIDTVAVEQDASGQLTIPLRSPQGGEFEIELTASRALTIPGGLAEGGKHRLVIPLPQPQADWVQSAPVVIVPANNVEVDPVEEDWAVSPPTETADATATDKVQTPSSAPRTVGLSRQSRRSLVTTMSIPPRQQEPLLYETEQGESVFVADIRYHRQKISATMQTEIRLHAPDNHVAQVFSYDVSYVPVERLTFWVPEELAGSEQSLTARIGSKSIELRDATPHPHEEIPVQYRKMQLVLPEALFQFQVVFSYPIPPVTLEHNQTTALALSFIRPADTSPSEHRVNVAVPTGFQIELATDAQSLWMPLDANSPFLRTESGMSFRSTQSSSRLSLWIASGARDALGTTVVERAWLQTWLTGSVRVDRGTFLVTSERRDAVSMRLPPAALQSRVFVYRDKQALEPAISPQGKLTIPLDEQSTGPVLIEIEYRISPFVTSNQRVELDMPHFEMNSDTLVRNEYWQIILPQHRHLLGVPGGWTPEYTWAWTKGLFWGRIPSMTLKDAGFDSDSTETRRVPPESNQYLFSSLNPPSSVSFYLLDRSWIILLSSGLALLVGLVLIYFPKTRYPGSLFGLGLAFLAMLLYRPAPVLLMLQASSLGVVLTLGALYIHRILDRDEPWVLPKHRSSWEEGSKQSEVYSVIIDDDSQQPNLAPTESLHDAQ